MQTLFIKKALPKRIGRELKPKQPLRLRTECAQCDDDKTINCQLVNGVWLCSEHAAKTR
jgi:hypothetical protein